MKKTKVWIRAILGALAVVALFIGSDLGGPRGRNAAIPSSAGYDLSGSGNIVASTPSTSKLVVYGYDGSTYQLYSTIESESGHHFDIGDVDNDPSTSEIAVAGFQSVGSKKNPAYAVCVRVYKEGFSGVWRSCSSSVTTTYPASNQVVIADVDNDSLNEILLVTVYNLVIFKYSSLDQNFSVLSSISNVKDLDGLDLILQSVAVAPEDVNGDGFKEIYVSSIIAGNIDRTLRGCLLIFQDYELSGFGLYPADGHLVNGQLRVGDINGDGEFEVCSPSCDYLGNNLYRSFICVWDKWGTSWNPIAIPGTDSSTYRLVKMNMGELNSSYPGQEIVFGQGKWLAVYKANNFGLNLIGQRTDFPMMPSGGINAIRIWDGNEDGTDEIYVGGSARSRGTSYGCYLAVFNAALNFLWEHAESPRNEGEVFDLAVWK
jgi:hypothetical protein